MDSVMQNDENLKGEASGTTAITVIIKDNQLYCANIGDSRAVACIKGKELALSTDHKPYQREEYDRIKAAGGWVDCDRVNGNLALSRAFGDFVFKRNPDKKPEEQIVTANPEVTVYTITPEWEFIVLACDGIWDVLSNYETVKQIRDRICDNIEPETICENIMSLCLAPDLGMSGMGCDNMTIIIVVFLNNGTYKKLSYSIRKEKEKKQQEEDELEEMLLLSPTDEEDEEIGNSNSEDQDQ